MPAAESRQPERASRPADRAVSRDDRRRDGLGRQISSGHEAAGTLGICLAHPRHQRGGDPRRSTKAMSSWSSNIGCRSARRCLELPAGLVGDETEGEAVEAAAIRELEEETGYRAGRMADLGRFHSLAGHGLGRLHPAPRRGLTKVGEGGGVDGRGYRGPPRRAGRVPAFVEAKRAEGRLRSTSSCCCCWRASCFASRHPAKPGSRRHYARSTPRDSGSPE